MAHQAAAGNTVNTEAEWQKAAGGDWVASVGALVTAQARRRAKMDGFALAAPRLCRRESEFLAVARYSTLLHSTVLYRVHRKTGAYGLGARWALWHGQRFRAQAVARVDERSCGTVQEAGVEQCQKRHGRVNGMRKRKFTRLVSAPEETASKYP